MAKVRRAYTIEEQQAIVEFRNKGYQFTQIGKLLDRSALSVAKKYREITHNNYEYFCRDFKYRLTPTEEKVISLMCKGLDDNEIAKTMTVALSTVKSHVHTIYSKYQVSGSVSRVKCVLKHLGYEVN